MINLLPASRRESISYARRNTMLRKWIVACGTGVLGIVLIIAIGLYVIDKNSRSWQNSVNQSKTQLEAQKIDETQRRISGISDSVKLVSQVLSRQILFSELLPQVGAAMPNGTQLQSLNINSIEGAINLTAGAADYTAATQVQVNLSDPKNKIFETADIVYVNCSGATNSEYPCTIQIRALFAKNNSFQYINKDKN